jgi:hypothetical protein
VGEMPKVVLNALKKRHDIREQQALGDVGQNVLVLEVQRWGDKLTVHICLFLTCLQYKRDPTFRSWWLLREVQVALIAYPDRMIACLRLRRKERKRKN